MFMRVMLKGEQECHYNHRLDRLRLKTDHEYAVEDVVRDYERKKEDVKALYERKMEGVKASYTRKLADETTCVTTAHDELTQELASVTTAYEENNSKDQHLTRRLMPCVMSTRKRSLRS